MENMDISLNFSEFPGMLILHLTEMHFNARSNHGTGLYEVPCYSFISHPKNHDEGDGTGNSF